MTRHQHEEPPWIDRQGIVLMLIVAVLAVALGTAAIWIAMH
jgi:hypothetical protein